jgi:hypothetical protein
MSLANIQSVVLRMVVDPQFATAVYQEASGSDDVIQEARLIPQPVMESFQTTVALKRMSTSIQSMLRFWDLIPDQKRSEMLRSFITEHVMYVNEWASIAPEFLRYIEAKLGDSIEEQVIKELTVFEGWAYDSSTREDGYQATADGYHVSPHVKVGTFRLPADCLISDQPIPFQELFPSLVIGYGTRSYLLAMHNEEEADLFEIDALSYEFLTQGQTKHSYEELLNLADKLLVQFLMTDKTPSELIEEFLKLGILIQNQQEAVAWHAE